MSRGVEVAGFPFGPQPIWSRLHTVELASYRLRKDSMKFPPLAVIESFPRGLLVPKQRFCPFFRLFPVFFRKLSVFSAFCRLFPPVSGNFQAVLNWTFSFFHFYRFNLWLQPIGLQHGYQYRSLHSSNSRRASRYFSCSSALLKLFIYFLSSSICVF